MSGHILTASVSEPDPIGVSQGVWLQWSRARRARLAHARGEDAQLACGMEIPP